MAKYFHPPFTHGRIRLSPCFMPGAMIKILPIYSPLRRSNSLRLLCGPPPPCNSPYIVNNFLRGILFLINEESGLPLYFLLHSASSFLTSFTLFPSIVNHLRIGRCSLFLLFCFYFPLRPRLFLHSISLKCVSNWARSDSQSQVVVLSFLFCLSGLCQLHSVLVGGSMPRLCQRDEMIYVSVRHRTTLSANTPLSCSFTLADFRLLKAEYKDVVR